MNGDGSIDYVGFVNEETGEVDHVVPISEYVKGHDEDVSETDDTPRHSDDRSRTSKDREESMPSVHAASDEGEGYSSPTASKHIREIPMSTEGNGVVDAIGYDVNGDGLIDYVGFVNEDTGEVDHVVPMSEYVKGHEEVKQENPPAASFQRNDDRDSYFSCTETSRTPPMCYKCKHPHFAHMTCPTCGHTWPRGPKTLRTVPSAQCLPLACPSVRPTRRVRLESHEVLQCAVDAGRPVMAHTPPPRPEAPLNTHRRPSIVTYEHRGKKRYEIVATRSTSETRHHVSVPPSSTHVTGGEKRLIHSRPEQGTARVRRGSVGDTMTRLGRYEPETSYEPPLSTDVHDAPPSPTPVLVHRRPSFVSYHHKGKDRGDIVGTRWMSDRRVKAAVSAGRISTHVSSAEERLQHSRPRLGTDRVHRVGGAPRARPEAHPRVSGSMYVPPRSAKVSQALSRLIADDYDRKHDDDGALVLPSTSPRFKRSVERERLESRVMHNDATNVEPAQRRHSESHPSNADDVASLQVRYVPPRLASHDQRESRGLVESAAPRRSYDERLKHRRSPHISHSRALELVIRRHRSKKTRDIVNRPHYPPVVPIMSKPPCRVVYPFTLGRSPLSAPRRRLVPNDRRRRDDPARKHSDYVASDMDLSVFGDLRERNDEWFSRQSA